MLKFLRKYQLFILVVGGSLLMVVFLLQPVITSFQQSQRNMTVARYADGKKVGAMDRDIASFELELARRIAPVIFTPAPQGLGLPVESEGEQDRVLHWLMLSRLAEEAGLVGGAEDGRQLIELQLAIEGQLFVQQNLMAVFQGLMTQQDLLSQAEQRNAMIRAQLNREVQSRVGIIPGTTEDDIWRMLAKFQGAYRLMGLYYGAPAFSPGGARDGVRDLNDAIAVDAAVIPGELLGSEIPDPSEDELRAFFEPRAGVAPADDAAGLGYAQPARVKISWLKLERAAFEQAATVDRVQLQKLWRQDSEKPEGERSYPGDFSSERARIESDLRRERGSQLMIAADQVIRSEVLTITRRLPTRDGIAELPDDWASIRPSLASIAESVVAGLATQGASIPTPTVQVLDDTWLGSGDLRGIPGIAPAAFRVGGRAVPVVQLPDLLDANGNMALIGLQTGVPQVEQSAQDTEGNRYYILISAYRPAGPAESIDDAGRDRVIADFKSFDGYRRLLARAEAMRDAARAPGGVAGAVDLGMPATLPDGMARPGVFPNLRVSKLRISPGPLARSVDPRLNSEAFRDAVLAAGEGIEPLATPQSLAIEPVTIVVPLEGSRSVAVARIVAPRPFTEDQFRSAFGQSLNELRGTAMRDAIDSSDIPDPFGYEALEARFGLKAVGRGLREDDAGA